MSWFSRKKAFEEEADILGVDFETEFDTIANAFNGLFKGDRVSASSNLLLTGGYKDVPGASVSITPSMSSLLYVWPVFVTTAGGVTGVVNVDGSDQAYEANTVQALCISLTAGAHTVKLRAKPIFVGAELQKTNTGFTYLLVPDPEP
jgi:hypothetical protein